MKSFLTAFLITLFSIYSTLHAQRNEALDSIQNLIPKQSDSMKIQSYVLLFNKTVSKEPELAKKFLDSANSIAEEFNDDMSTAFVFNRYGSYYNRIADFRKAEEVIKKSIDLLEKNDKKVHLTKSYRNLGMVQNNLGKYQESIANLMISLRLQDSLEFTPLRKVSVYNSLGAIHGRIGNIDKSIYYNEKIEKIYIENDKQERLPIVWNNLAINYKKLDKYETALHYYKKCLKSYLDAKNNFKLALIHNNLTDLYLEIDSLNLADSHSKKALEAGEISKNSTQVASSLFYQGIVNTRKNKFERALDYLKRAEAMALRNGRKKRVADIYRNMAEAYSGMSNFRKAYEIKLAHSQLKDSILNQEAIDKINELEIQYQTEKKEQDLELKQKEIESLEQKSEINKLQKTLLGTGLGLSLLAIGFGFYGFKQRSKRNRLEKEKLDTELSYKKKELTTHALHLAQKNEVLESIKLKAKDLMSSRSSEEYRQLIQTINFDQQNDKGWESFVQYFEAVHKDFNSKVSSKYPNISPNELRLMALIKMNLSSKEMANVLNISIPGIKKARQRLRKKMNLNTKDSLEQAVLAI